MKNNIIKILKCPITWVTFSLVFTLFCLILNCFIVETYPNAIDDDLFIVGARFGLLSFGFLEGVFYTGSSLISLGKWLNKRKVENNGSSNSKD